MMGRRYGVFQNLGTVDCPCWVKRAGYVARTGEAAIEKFFRRHPVLRLGAGQFRAHVLCGKAARK